MKYDFSGYSTLHSVRDYLAVSGLDRNSIDLAIAIVEVKIAEINLDYCCKKMGVSL